MESSTQAWERYAQAVISSMSDVLEEAPAETRALMLETADYWLSLGLAIALARPDSGERLLTLALAHENEDRAEILEDANAFCAEALL